MKLLKLPIEEDLTVNRIEALYQALYENPEAEKYVGEILEMLLDFIDEYEGHYIEQAIFRISEGKNWWNNAWDDENVE